MRRRTAVVAAGLVLAGAVVGAVLMAFLGNRDEPAREAGVDPGRLALSPEGAELVSLLQKGEEATYHARYRAVSSEDQAAGALTILLWRKPPLVRQDLLVSASGQTARSAGFLLEDRAVTCLRDPAGDWTCSSEAGVRAEGPEALIRDLTEQVEAGPIRARDATVAGTAARCFTLPLGGGSGEVCLTESGVPARISAGPSRIELVDLVETFSEAVFRLPASPGAGG